MIYIRHFKLLSLENIQQKPQKIAVYFLTLKNPDVRKPVSRSLLKIAPADFGLETTALVGLSNIFIRLHNPVVQQI